MVHWIMCTSSGYSHQRDVVQRRLFPMTSALSNESTVVVYVTRIVEPTSPWHGQSILNTSQQKHLATSVALLSTSCICSLWFAYELEEHNFAALVFFVLTTWVRLVPWGNKAKMESRVRRWRNQEGPGWSIWQCWKSFWQISFSVALQSLDCCYWSLYGFCSVLRVLISLNGIAS